jgi:hypothetical protein
MSRFDPLYHIRMTCTTDPRQAAYIVEFLNKHTEELSCNNTSFYVRDCNVYATCIKPSRIEFINGVIIGFLLSKGV